MKHIIIAVIIIVVLAGGVFFMLNQTSEGPVSQDTAGTAQTDTPGETRMVEGYQGTVLAGSTTPLLDFQQSDYEKALSEEKVIFLSFYANWCPICRAEQPAIFDGFDQLSLDNVVGFQVNYKDSDTDSAEEALASEFEVPYQHTKVIIKNGQEVFKETKQWDREELVDTLTQYSN